MKLEPARIAVSSGIPPCHTDKRYAATIVYDINIEHGSDISRKSATMMALQGRIGEPPKTRVPNRNISSKVWSLMKGAFVPFLRLDEDRGATQSTMKELSL